MVNTCRYIHTSSILQCNNDIYNRKSNEYMKNSDSKVKNDLESDWSALNNDDIKKYTYWEIPLDENDDDDEFAKDRSNPEALSDSKKLKISANNNAANDTDHVINQALTHTDQSGRLNMVDIGEKDDSSRTAVAVGSIFLGKEAFQLVKKNKMKKGDVLTVARLAGITGAKRTSELIPLCHNIPLSKIDVDLHLLEESYAVTVSCLAKTYGKTGVEMEAITGVAIATVTIYDMCKAVTKDMVIGDIKLKHKSGGKSGDYTSVL